MNSNNQTGTILRQASAVGLLPVSSGQRACRHCVRGEQQRRQQRQQQSNNSGNGSGTAPATAPTTRRQRPQQGFRRSRPRAQWKGQRPRQVGEAEPLRHPSECADHRQRQKRSRPQATCASAITAAGGTVNRKFHSISGVWRYRAGGRREGARAAPTSGAVAPNRTVVARTQQPGDGHRSRRRAQPRRRRVGSTAPASASRSSIPESCPRTAPCSHPMAPRASRSASISPRRSPPSTIPSTAAAASSRTPMATARWSRRSRPAHRCPPRWTPPASRPALPSTMCASSTTTASATSPRRSRESTGSSPTPRSTASAS